MPPSLSSLLSLWERHYDQGRDVPAAELCPDHPELVAGLEDAIDALKQVRRLLLPSTTDGSTHDSVVTADPPQRRAAESCPPGYEILGTLGRGGMAVVYRARQVTLGREVALKMILAGAHAGPEARARFLAEAKAVAATRHPGVVQIYDYGTHQDNPYFAQELCDGGSLADLLRQRPLPAAEAVRLLEQVARAVQAAHQAGVIHRDLKPGNVLLCSPVSPRPDEPRVPEGRDYIPKVADFGLAKQRDGDDGMTDPDAVVGTPAYMSPEQAVGGKDVGVGTDVWALGVILYECLTGRPPFLAADWVETLLQVRGVDPVPPRRLNAKVPRDLETICLKCLHKDVGRRYASAAALADDLGRFQRGEPIVARPVGVLERGWKWARRYPTVAALMATIVVGVGVAFGLVDRERRKTASALQTAESNLARAEGAEAEAKANEATALANLRQAEQAVDECFGLAKDNAIAELANLREAQKLLLGKTLPYYSTFVQANPTDAHLAFKQADYLSRIAYITQEIGSKQEAAAVYEKAAHVLDGLYRSYPTDTRYQVVLAGTVNDLALLKGQLGRQDEAFQGLERARSLFATLAETYPDTLKHKADLSSIHNNMGSLHSQSGNLPLAERHLEQARGIREQLRAADPTAPEYQSDLAATYVNLGNLQTAAGNLDKACTFYDTAIPIQAQLCREHPRNTKYQTSLATTYSNTGKIRQQLGKPDEALQRHDKARGIREAVLQAFPEVAEHREELAKAHHHLGILYGSMNRAPDALRHHDRARGLLDQLCQSQAKTAELQVQLVSTCNTVALLQRQTGSTTDALRTYDQAKQVGEALVRAAPTNQDYQLELGGTLVNLSNCLRDGNKLSDSLQAVDRAVQLLTPVHQGRPGHAGTRRYLRNAHWGRARVLGLLRRHRDSLADWDETVRLTPTSPQLDRIRFARGDALARAGDYRLAMAELTALSQAQVSPTDILYYNRACLASLCAGACHQDAARPLAVRERQADLWARQAFDFLRRAERSGYFKQAAAIDHLKKDDDLAYLRDRPDFQAFARSLPQP